MVPSGCGSTSTNRLASSGTGANTATVSPGRVSLRSTTWVPRLGRRLTSSTRSPAQTPVALMTVLARTLWSVPVSSSRSSTPCPVAETTRARVRTCAPSDAAVRAIVVTRRASSSSWPSHDSSPPRRPAERSGGAICITSVADSLRGPGRVSALVPALRRSASPAIRPARVLAAMARDIDDDTGTTIGSAWVR
jgi:hypothetical protein